MENLHNGKSNQWIKDNFLNLELYLKIRTFYRTKMVLYFFIMSNYRKNIRHLENSDGSKSY